MAKIEIQLNKSDNGLSITAQIKSIGGTQVGSDYNLSEIGGSTGFYSVDIVEPLADGVYLVSVFDGNDLQGSEVLEWNGTYQELVSTLNNFDHVGDEVAKVALVTTTTTNTDMLTAAAVNAEVVDVIRTDTVAELAGVPSATSSLMDKINWVFMLARNKGTQTSTTKTLLADDTTTVVSTSAVSDDGTTFTRGEYS